jgi:membrane-associated phospholipid phosphatase
MKKNTLPALIVALLLNAQPMAALSNHDYFSEVVMRFPSEPALGQTLLAGAVLSAAAMPFDKQINQKLNENRLLSANLSHYGHAYLDNFVALALLGGGALHQGYKTEDYGTPIRFSASSLILTTGATLFLKKITGRTRPNGKKASFPSGHSSITFCVASVLHQWYGIEAAIPAYGAAAFTAFSRVQDNYHWLSDVIFGAALGMAIPYGLYEAEKNWGYKPPQSAPLSFRWTISL